MFNFLSEGVSYLHGLNKQRLDDKQLSNDLIARSLDPQEVQVEVAALVSSLLNPERND